MRAGAGESAGRSVVIVGGGVIGACAAFFAMREGMNVTLIERDPTLGDSCSIGNGGMVVPSHFVPLASPGMVGKGLRMMLNPESPFSIRPSLDARLLDWALRFARSCTKEHVTRSSPLLRDLNLQSRRLYEEMQRLPGWDFGLEKNGLLMLCRTAEALHEEAEGAATANELGVPAEVLNAAQTGEKDPAIRMEVAGSVFYPLDCHLTPGRFMGAVRRALDEGGVQTLWATAATGWRVEGGRIAAVTTGAGEISADEFVLAGGAWSTQLIQPLGLRMPMQAGKGYSVTLADPPELPHICSILTEARIAVTPMGRALRFAGTMEIVGLDQSVNERRLAGILKSVPRYFPGFGESDFRSLPVWVGLRPVSPDGLPYLGRTSRFQNLVVATGHAMMGMSLGPVTGKLVADVLAGKSVPEDLAPLSPDRFG